MSTRAQRRAARLNARKSTGPRTPEGKAVSARNATTHNLSGSTLVLLPGEDRNEFQKLVADHLAEWRPSTAHENFLVTGMINARWRLNRIARMEAELVNACLYEFGDGQSDEGAILIANQVNPDAQRRLHRYAQDAERSYHRSVRELRAYRKQLAADREASRKADQAAAHAAPSAQAEPNTRVAAVGAAARNEPKPLAADSARDAATSPANRADAFRPVAPGHESHHAAAAA